MPLLQQSSSTSCQTHKQSDLGKGMGNRLGCFRWIFLVCVSRSQIYFLSLEVKLLLRETASKIHVQTSRESLYQQVAREKRKRLYEWQQGWRGMHIMTKVSQMKRSKPWLHFPGQDVTKLRMRVRSHENIEVKSTYPNSSQAAITLPTGLQCCFLLCEKCKLNHVPLGTCWLSRLCPSFGEEVQVTVCLSTLAQSSLFVSPVEKRDQLM